MNEEDAPEEKDSPRLGIASPAAASALQDDVADEIVDRLKAEKDKSSPGDSALDADASTPSEPASSDASAADHTPAEPTTGADSAPSEHEAANDDSTAVPAASSSHAASRRNRSRYGDSKPDHYAKLNKRRRERY